MNKLSNILQSPLFSALIITLIIIYFLPDYFDKYKIELIDSDYSNYITYYNDLDNDGKSEKISVRKNSKYTDFIIRDYNGAILGQINLTPNAIFLNKVSFGDYNNDGLNEIYFFSQKNDSIFLHGFNPLAKYRATTFMKPKFIDTIGKYGGFKLSCNVSNVKLMDLNNDNYKEAIFTIGTGFPLQPRNLYCYNIKENKIIKSPKSGAGIWSTIFISYDVDNDKIDEFMYPTAAYGNFPSSELIMSCKNSTNEDSIQFYDHYKQLAGIKYDDHSAWLMVYDNNLKFLFEPVEFPSFTSTINPMPYKINNEVFIAVLYQYAGKEKKKPALYLYNIKGKKIKEKKFSKENKVEGYYNIITLSSKKRDRLYLIDKKGNINQLNEDLDTIDSYKINEDINWHSIKKLDIDGDSENELIFLTRDGQKLIIIRNDFSHPVTVEIPNKGGGNILSVKLNGKNAPNIFVQIFNRDIQKGAESYLFSYSFNPLYNVKYLIYIGLFIGLSLFLFIMKKIWFRKLEQDKKNLERIVKERTKEVTLKNEELKQQNEEIIAQRDEIEGQRDEIKSQRDLVIEQKTELEKLSIVASETDNGVIICDKNGIIEWVNRGFERLYGLTLEEFTSKHGKSIYETSSNPGSQQVVNEAVGNNCSITYNSPFTKETGKTVWLQTTLTPIFDETGSLKKLVAIESDITKIKEAEEEIRKQKEQIEKIYQEVTDSINYAKRIQTSALPDMNIARKCLSDIFVLFKPKDVVSGDFYWFAKVENQLVITVADCTGHGVPGAFMSMMGMNMLKEIVVKEYMTQPDIILRRLRKEVIKTLGQTGKYGESRDGMDMSLCSINTETFELQWSGANNSCLLVQNGELIDIKPDKMPIAIYEKMDRFTLHKLPLKKGDIIYLISDGFPDQFGGQKGKKFMSKRMKRLLLEISDKPMKEQYEILDKTLYDWMNNHGEKYEQTDDITVMGVKI